LKPNYLLYCKASTEKPEVVLKLHIKSLVSLFNMVVRVHSVYAESETGGELRSFEKLSLALRMCFWSANASSGWKSAYVIGRGIREE